MLAEYLVSKGHEVVWWNSDFDHHKKCHRKGDDALLQSASGAQIFLLHGCGYTGHVSLGRLRDHRQVARKFLDKSGLFPVPDVIISGYPPIELAAACVTYGKKNGVPVALDIRDAWPDIFVHAAPKGTRFFAKMALSLYDRFARSTLRGANALFSLTEPFLDWGLAKANRRRVAEDAVIPMAYESDPLADLSRESVAYWQSQGLDPQKHWIICLFCTFGRQFDIVTIIEAAKRLRRAGVSDVRFVLCGQGEGLEGYRQRSKDLDNVIFPGWVNQKHIRALMAISRAGLAPYFPDRNFRGNCPNKPVEYLAAGLPVMTCLEGFLSDMVKRERVGYVYEVASVDSLVGVVEAARADSGHSSMRSRCLALFEKYYRSDAVLSHYHDCIIELAGEK